MSPGSRRLSFGRRRQEPDAAVATGSAAAGVGAADDGATAGRVSLSKGRPTPKRSQAERRRGGPVPPPPANRKEAARRLRAQQAEDRRLGRAATDSGDDSRMLARDAGPARRAIRDIIDGRRNVAVLLLPVAFLLILAGFTHNVPVLYVLTRLWVATLVAVVIDVVLIVLSIRRRLRTVEDDRGSGGNLVYGLMRSTVIRRFRTPKPRVAPARLFGSR